MPCSFYTSFLRFNCNIIFTQFVQPSILNLSRRYYISSRYVPQIPAGAGVFLSTWGLHWCVTAQSICSITLQPPAAAGWVGVPSLLSLSLFLSHAVFMATKTGADPSARGPLSTVTVLASERTHSRRETWQYVANISDSRRGVGMRGWGEPAGTTTVHLYKMWSGAKMSNYGLRREPHGSWRDLECVQAWAQALSWSTKLNAITCIFHHTIRTLSCSIFLHL